MRRGGRHPAWPCIGAGRQLWLGRRFGHLMALGSRRRHGRDPVDPGFLDLAGPGAREPRFRDLGLPGDRRLTFTPTRKEHAYDLSLAPTVGFLVFTPPVAASLSRVVRATVIDARPVLRFALDSPPEESGFELSVPSDRAVSNRDGSPFVTLGGSALQQGRNLQGQVRSGAGWAQALQQALGLDDRSADVGLPFLRSLARSDSCDRDFLLCSFADGRGGNRFLVGLEGDVSSGNKAVMEVG